MAIDINSFKSTSVQPSVEINPKYNSNMGTTNQLSMLSKDTLQLSNKQVSSQQPEKKGMSTLAKLGIGAVVTTGVAVGADFLFAKGKHVKNILKLSKKKVKPDAKPEIKPKNPEVKPVESACIKLDEKLYDCELLGTTSYNIMLDQVERNLCKKYMRDIVKSKNPDETLKIIKDIGLTKYKVPLEPIKKAEELGVDLDFVLERQNIECVQKMSFPQNASISEKLQILFDQKVANANAKLMEWNRVSIEELEKSVNNKNSAAANAFSTEIIEQCNWFLSL